MFRDEKKWFEFGAQETMLLAGLDIILMRKDPPFDLEYIYTTYILENAERDGVVNKRKSCAMPMKNFYNTISAMLSANLSNA